MYTLKKGDCLGLMDAIPEGSVDMVLCDLPYGTTACKWDSVIDLQKLWTQYKRVVKKNGAIILFGSQPFTSTLIVSNLEMFKYCWVWEKSKSSNFQHSKFQPLKKHEDLAVFSRGGSAQGSNTPMAYFPQFEEGAEYNGYNNPIGAIGHLSKGNLIASTVKKGKLRFPKSVLYFKTAESEAESKGGLHPTQKPLALCEYLVRTYTNEGDLVLDNTMGSGTTGVACANTGRRFYGIELNDYFEAAEKRIQDAYWNKQLILPSAADAFDSQW